MTQDNICWDRDEENYDDNYRQVNDEEYEMWLEDCTSRAQDMMQEVK